MLSREKMENKYYKDRYGNFYTKKSKIELQERIDDNDPSTFLPVLEEMNYPYIEEVWNNCVEFAKKHNLYNLKHSIIGKYIAKMNLLGFRAFTWKDTKFIAMLFENAKRREMELKNAINE